MNLESLLVIIDWKGSLSRATWHHLESGSTGVSHWVCSKLRICRNAMWALSSVLHLASPKSCIILGIENKLSKNEGLYLQITSIPVWLYHLLTTFTCCWSTRKIWLRLIVLYVDLIVSAATRRKTYVAHLECIDSNVSYGKIQPSQAKLRAQPWTPKLR